MTATPWLYQIVTVTTSETPSRFKVITYPDPTGPYPDPDPEDKTDGECGAT